MLESRSKRGTEGIFWPEREAPSYVSEVVLRNARLRKARLLRNWNRQRAMQRVFGKEKPRQQAQESRTTEEERGLEEKILPLEG